jgi:hypothetical protein
MWVVADLNDDYIAKMEDVLEVYKQLNSYEREVASLQNKNRPSQGGYWGADRRARCQHRRYSGQLHPSLLAAFVAPADALARSRAGKRRRAL